MSESKARERTEFRLKQEAMDRANGVAILAAILSAQTMVHADQIADERVREARRLVDAAYRAEGLPSPFPATVGDET